MKLLRRITLLVACYFLIAFSARSQQVAGGEITYTCLGNDQYQVTLSLYAKCPNVSFLNQVTANAFASTVQSAIPFTLTRSGADQTIMACPGNPSKCGGGTGENADALVKRTYKGNITLPQKLSEWVIFYQSSSSRVALSTVSGNTLMYLQAIINNTGTYCNNSATFGSSTLGFYNKGQNITYDPGITSPDNDPIQVALITPKITDKTSITYSAPFTTAKPITTSGAYSINASTGVLSFNPSTQGEMSTTAIEVKDIRNGVVVGSVMREMYLQTLAEQTSPPYFSGQDTLKFCTNSAVNINYTGLTNVPGKTVDIIWNNKADWGKTSADSGNTFKVVPGNGSATFQLNAGVATTSYTRVLDLTLFDNTCGKVNKTVVVQVNTRPTVIRSSLDSTVVCLKPFNLTIRVAGGKIPYSYAWEGRPENSPTINVTAVGTYRVTVTDANLCTATWSKTIRSPIKFRTGPVSCVDSSIAFFDISAGCNTVCPLPTTKVWTWSFGDNSADNNSQSPTHKFPAPGIYSVTMKISDGNGCENSIVQNVKVYGKPKVAFIFVDSCQSTERSDLKVSDLIQVSGIFDTLTRDANIRFYVDGVLRTTAFGNRRPTKLNEFRLGSHKVTVWAKNDAGCVDTLSKTINMYAKPKINSPRASYYYRCNSPGFPDTTFNFKATGESLKINIKRSNKLDSLLNSYISGSDLKVPYKVRQNLANAVTIETTDKFGCTNDTLVSILDPVNPVIDLVKYYCFLNDTLKLQDFTFLNRNYKWGLDSSLWNMKDGQTDSTIGFVNHAYSLKALDEATVSLSVTDKSGCKDSTTIKVYLSEPDTNQFQIIKPMACFADTVRIMGIKNKYINAWYNRDADQPEIVYQTPDRTVINPSFGVAIPSSVDAIRFFDSKGYVASTSIFYNEPNSTLNFVKNPNGTVIIPRIPSNVCHLESKRNWKVVDRRRYKMLDNYDHCFDSLKVFFADTLNPISSTTTLSTWSWTLLSPNNAVVNTQINTDLSDLQYQPSTSLFSQVATTRAFYNNQADPNNRFLPYTIKGKYTYRSDTITCRDSVTLKVANEKVMVQIDTTRNLTCASYSNTYLFNMVRFLEGINIDSQTSFDEAAQTVWEFGDGTSDTAQVGGVAYFQPGTYKIKATATNYYGCQSIDSASVTVKPSPIAALSIDPICFGKESVLNGSKSSASDPASFIASYYWFYSNTDTIPFNSNKEPDTLKAVTTSKDSIIYQNFQVGVTPVGLAVRDANGCYDTTLMVPARVNVLPSIDFTIKTLAGDEDYLGNEQLVYDQNSTNVNYWEWDMGDGNKVLAKGGDTLYTYPYYAPPFPLDKNKYTIKLRVKTAEGCIDSASKKIDVNAYFEVPNAFSPNDDGLHDQLLSVGKGIKEIKEFKIFNRWGEEIYSVNGRPEKDALKRGYLLWDGKYNGQVQPVGAYVYYAVVTTGYGNDIIKKGNLSLLR